jgi:hypothetical protein
MMNAAMAHTASTAPRAAPTRKSSPLSSPRKNTTGPVIQGNPMMSPPNVAPHRRAASVITATSTGGTEILSSSASNVIRLWSSG